MKNSRFTLTPFLSLLSLLLLLAGPARAALGAALHFDGVDDYVSIPGTMVDGQAQATIEGWFKINGNSQYDQLFGKTGLYVMGVNSPE